MIRLLLLVIPVVFSVSFADIVWETDFSIAQKKAKEQGRDVFILFTNSDASLVDGKSVYKELEDGQFVDQVKDDYVFIEINSSPVQQTDEKKRWFNSSLASQYGVGEFTLAVVFADEEGRPYYAFTGQHPLERTIKEAHAAHTVKKSFDEAMRALPNALGKDRYKLIGDIVRPLPDSVAHAYYEDLVQDALDKDELDYSGLRYSKKKKEQEEELGKFLESKVDHIATAPLESIKEIEAYANGPLILPESRQILLAQTAFIMADVGLADEAVARLKQAIDVAPDTRNAEYFKKIKENIEKNRKMIINSLKGNREEKEDSAL